MIPADAALLDPVAAAAEEEHDADDAEPRDARHVEGFYERGAGWVTDLRSSPPDMFDDYSSTNWRELSWKQVGKPYTVEKWASGKLDWEREHGSPLPVQEGWRMFNRSFHQMFLSEPGEDKAKARRGFLRSLAKLEMAGAGEALEDWLHLWIWNRVHRIEDGVWDPRGKRALFEGLDVKRPRVLFLGASDGYEAMQLLACYPGGEAVLVDYDDFCATDRFGKFPSTYPFLGRDPATGHRRVYYRDDMKIDYVVADARDLDYGREFDIVVSIGLVEHLPDQAKPMAFEWHRKFLKPGGYAIITAPRNQWRSRFFYNAMSDLMNFGYRELLTIEQLGLYAWENGFDIERAGVIKAHNGLICRAR